MSSMSVNIGLRLCSARRPSLFILERNESAEISVQHNVLMKIMYADDIVIVAEHWEELQGALEEWNGLFKKYMEHIIIIMYLEKTEVAWV